MSEAPVKQTESQPAPASDQTQTQQEAVSLEDIYKQYNVSAETQPPAQTAQTQQTQQPAQPHEEAVPDPALDPKGFERWARSRESREKQTREALLQVAGAVRQFQDAQTRQAEEADIRKAVDVVREKVDADPDFVEISIAHKARKDPKFMALWNGRHKNPQAWDAALKVVANELGSKFSMKSDPRITADLRAARQSQSTMATAKPEESAEAQLGKLQGAEFDRALDAFRNRA